MIVRSYTEDGFGDIEKVFLSDAEYEKALRTFVIMCTDIVLVNFSTRTIFLAKRKAKPLADWWFIGGRIHARETKKNLLKDAFYEKQG